MRKYLAWELAKVCLAALGILVAAYVACWLVASCVPAECPPPRREAGATVRRSPMVPDDE